jgi:hypothetical protein
MAQDLTMSFSDEDFGDKPKAPKVDSKVAALDKAANEHLEKTLPKMIDVYNLGKAKDFSAKQSNLAKYATYGSKTYGKLGFDPYKAGGIPGVKSGMDKYYDDNTHWSQDIGRAWDGMWKLAGIGLQDTFGLGAFADSGNYLDFEDTMGKYSSTRGGNAGFWSNTMLSSGYTIGIIGGIAAEELALAGITAATGGTAAPGTVLAGGTLLARGVARIKEAGNMLKFVNKLQDVETATSFWGKGKALVGSSVKGFGKALNPLENTMDFIFTADKLKDLNGWKQTALGVGSLVRDARKITMSHSESKLEADLASKEFKQTMYDEWYKKKGNAGKEIPDWYTNKVEKESANLYNDIYKSNFGLIYATNAITFDNMLKTMKGTNKFFSNATDLFKVVRKEGGKVAVEAMKKNVWNYGRKKLGELSWQGSLKSVLSSSMEGVQELGQDIISESNKSYYARNVKGTQLRGGFMTYLEKDLKDAAAKQKSEQGWSTFLSGAMMGVFASPVGIVTQGTQTYLFDGGLGKTKQFFTDREKFRQEKNDALARRKERAKVLTEFFNNEKNFTQSWSKPIYSQTELQEQILEAGERGDQKTMKSKQHESLVAGVHAMLESGMENEFAKHIEYMSKNFDAQQLNEIFSRTDITEENKGEWQKKLKTQANTVRNLRGLYNEINNTINNPINIRTLNRKDPDFMDKLFKYQAIENLKKELLFSHSKIADRANRQADLRTEINNENPLTTLEINSLLDDASLEQQIQLLKTEVDTNSKLTISGDGAVQNQATAKAKLKAYQNYQEKLKAYQKLQQDETATISESDTFDDLFEAYNEILQVSGKNNLINPQAQREFNRQQFDKIFDYLSLGQENKYYQEFVDTVLNPEGSSAFIQGQEEMLKRLEENKEDHILNALYEFDKKAVSDDMLNELYDNDLFFDLQELDELVDKRLMPTEIFDITTNKLATPEQYEKAQQIINAYIKKLTGKTITNDKTQLNKAGRRLKSDKRLVATILNQYKIKLNEPIKLSSKEGQRLMDKLMSPDNKFMTSIDKEILQKLGMPDVTIKFVSDNTLPVKLTQDGVIELDVRFAGKDYLNASMSFENLVITGLTQHVITEKLKANDDLYLAARSAMEQAKKEFRAKYPGANVDELDVFNDVNLFMTEAMNDMQLQKFLGSVEDNIQPASQSLWKTVSEGIEVLVEENFDKKLANRVINIAAKALDESIVADISETQEDNKEVREQKEQAQKQKAEELTKLAKELGQRWNVNVQVINTQAEAEDLMNKINPMLQLDEEKITGFYDEKTNTAYIVADAVNENTVYHEVFLHPFLINLEKSNPEFYKQLVAEAKANQEIVDYVTQKYGTPEEIGSRQFEHELVGRVYDLSVNNKLSEKTEPGLFKKIGQFIKRMFTKVAEFLNISKSDIGRFNPRKTTIADLATYSVTSSDKINLGKIIEASQVAQPTEETVKPRTRKKTVQSVRTVIEEQTVNKGGDLVVLDNAGERPDLFGEFLHPEIVFGNNLLIAEWTQKLVDLGQELDDARITNWVYGNIRAQVDGRLVIDVTAEVPVFVKKALKNKKANPKVAQLQNEIADLDSRIKELSKQKKKSPRQEALDSIQFVAADFDHYVVPGLFKDRKFTFEKDAIKAINEYFDNQTQPKSTTDTNAIRNDIGALREMFDSAYLTPVQSTFYYEARKELEAEAKKNKPLFGKIKTVTREEVEKRGFENFVKAVQSTKDTTNTTELNYTIFDGLGGWLIKNKSANATKDLINSDSHPDFRHEYGVKRNQNWAEFDEGFSVEGKRVVNIKVPVRTDENTNRPSVYFSFTLELPEGFTAESVATPIIEKLKQFGGKASTKELIPIVVQQAKEIIQKGPQGQKKITLSDLPIVEDNVNSEKVMGKAIYIPMSVYEEAYANDTANNTQNGQPLAQIIARGGYAVRELDQLLPDWKERVYAINNPEASLFDSMDVETSLENDTIDREIEATLKKRNALQDQLNKEDQELIEEGEEVVQQGTKKVRFLMYKSTGTGSTAASAGEWVPLLAIGKFDDGTEWFVKSFYKGEDPKFNKYGSSVFADIDRDLKTSESQLFGEPENWVTETIEREVVEETEIEEEIPVDEQPAPVEDKDAYRPRTEILNDLENIKSEIKNLEAKYDALLQDINSGNLSMNQKRKAKRNLELMAIDINDLYAQLNDMQGDIDMSDSEINLAVQDLDYVPIYDYNGNEIITEYTPWLDIPQSLRNELAELFGKPLNKLTEDDVLKIKENLKSNPEYISTVNAFTQERLRSQDEKLGAEEAAKNRERIEQQKLATQQREQQFREQSRADKKQKRLAKTKVTDEDILKNILQGYDYSILTTEEIKQLVSELKNKKITANDLIAYVSNKKIKQAQKEKAEKKEKAQIKNNMSLFEKYEIPYTNSDGKKIKMRIPNNGMRKFIMTYFSEIFSLSEQEFLNELNNILTERTAFVKQFKVDPELFVKGDKKIYIKIYNLFKKLEKQKQLYPDVVKKINLALFDAETSWRIKMADKNGSVSSMYQIKKVKDAKKIIPLGVYGKSKQIKNEEENADNELDEILNQEINTDEAVDTVVTLQFLNTPEGKEIIDEDVAEMDRVATSTENELINGEFTGNEDELSDTEIELLNIGEEEDIDPLDAEAANDAANAEIEFPEEFDQPLSKELSKIDTYFNNLQSIAALPFNGQLSNMLGEVWKEIESSDKKQGDLSYAIAAFKLVTSGRFKFSEPQIGQTVNIIRRQIGNGIYRDQVVQINGNPYRVTVIEKGKVILQDLQNLSSYPGFEVNDFLNSVEKVFEPGETITNINVDTVVKVEEFDYIKEAYNDILNNFTSYIGEANSLSEADLLSNLKKETTKCK